MTNSGKSGHGAIPHHTIDSIAIAAQVITAFHQIVSRRINPEYAAVLSICSINTVDTYNVIPEEVVLRGTVRCFDVKVRDQLKDEMIKIANGICQSWGAVADMQYYYGYPPLHNDTKMAEIIRMATADIDGAISDPVSMPPMAGEDFAIFAEHRPTAFFFTGTGSDKCRELWHNYAFDIEEEALEYGAKVFVNAAQIFANEKKITKK